MDLENVFSNTSNLSILINGAGKFYIPGVINGMGSWNILEGYIIYVNDIDSVLIEGQLTPFDTPMSLTSGWNLISYLPENSISVETALNTIISELSIVKKDDGSFFIPNVINTIGSMETGEGYKLYINNSATLVYPSNQLLSKSNVSLIDSTIHFTFKDNTGESYSIVIDNVTIDGNLLAEKYEVGVFISSGLCVGASSYNGNFPLALTAWADDSQTPEIDGYAAGDTMKFHIWDESDNKEYIAAANYSFGNGFFGNGPYCRVDLSVTTTSVDNISNQIPSSFLLYPSYPNPFNPATTITFSLPSPEKVVINILNIKGQLISTLVNEQKEAGVYHVTWNAMDEPSGIYFCNFQSGKYSKTIKLLLVK